MSALNVFIQNHFKLDIARPLLIATIIQILIWYAFHTHMIHRHNEGELLLEGSWVHGSTLPSLPSQHYHVVVFYTTSRNLGRTRSHICQIKAEERYEDSRRTSTVVFRSTDVGRQIELIPHIDQKSEFLRVVHSRLGGPGFCIPQGLMILQNRVWLLEGHFCNGYPHGPGGQGRGRT